VSLPVGDPFRKLLGPECIGSLVSHASGAGCRPAEMGRRHQYSRGGISLPLVFEKVENLAQSRGL